MKYRIVIWTVAGFLIAGGWALFSFAMPPMAVSPASPVVWTLARVTCPVVFVSFYFHFGIQLYWVLLANAATYALLGLVVESLRRRRIHAS